MKKRKLEEKCLTRLRIINNLDLAIKEKNES